MQEVNYCVAETVTCVYEVREHFDVKLAFQYFTDMLSFLWYPRETIIVNRAPLLSLEVDMCANACYSVR